MHNNIDETMCFCYQSINTTIKCIDTMKHHFILTGCAKYMSEDVHQNGCFKCEILLLISLSVYLFLDVSTAISNLLHTTTAKWRHISHFMQT